MTTNIEQKFFECFGIKEVGLKDYNYDTLAYSFKTVEINGKRYPQITSDIILKLICIYIGYERIYMGTFELDHFKRFILASLIDLYKEMRDVSKKERLKHQVQSLFTEVGEWIY